MAQGSALAVIALLCCTAAHGLYTASGPVVQLTAKDFDKKVLQSEGVWLVEFYAPWCGHCKSLTPEWEKAAKALKGIVNIAAVDATAEQALGSKYNVQGFPTIKIFGADKTAPSEYQGGRTADAIVNEALKEASKVARDRLSGKKKSSGSSSGSGSGKKGSSSNSDVVELTEANFEELVLNSNEPWLIEFFAPWCGHCKALAPEWERAASELQGSVKVGAVDATVHGSLASKYGVKGYPTLKYFGQDKTAPQDMNVARTADAIIEFGLQKAEEAGVGLDVTEVASEEKFQECLGKRLCVLGFLPHLIDGGKADRTRYIDVLKEVLKKTRSKQVAVSWVQGGTQPELESSLSVSSGYPTMAVVSKSKKRYYTHRLAFSADAMVKAVKGLTEGRRDIITQPLNKVPTLATVTPWDGEDYVPPADE